LKTIDDFHERVRFYREEADAGRYHNPYDVDNELQEILIKLDIVDNRIKYEDVAYSTGLLFWDM
jgi:hypothetical protein